MDPIFAELRPEVIFHPRRTPGPMELSLGSAKNNVFGTAHWPTCARVQGGSVVMI